MYSLFVPSALTVRSINRIEELTSGATVHAKLALYALASRIITGDRETHKTREIYERYVSICELVATDPITENGLYRQLKEQAFLGVIESEKTGGGRSQGSYLLHRLVTDPKHIIKAVRRDSSLEDLPTYDRLGDSASATTERDAELSSFS